MDGVFPLSGRADKGFPGARVLDQRGVCVVDGHLLGHREGELS
jgi:hypothetical protein